MYLIRAIAGFILIFIGFIGVAAAFLTNPIAIAVPLITIPLALYIMGYISIFAPAKSHLQYQQEQREIASSSSYKYRGLLIGIISLVLGLGGSYGIYKSGEWPDDILAAAGTLMFTAFGIFIIYGYIFGEKGLTALGIKTVKKDNSLGSIQERYTNCKRLPGKEHCKGSMMTSLLERNKLTWDDIEYHVNNDTGISKYLTHTRELLNNYGNDLPGVVKKIDEELATLVKERFPGRQQ